MIFLNKIGVPWPAIDEDVLWQFATLVREFGQAVETTHNDATKSVTGIAAAYQASSTQVMESGWNNLTSAVVDELVALCEKLAKALDIAGDFTRGQKVIAMVELGVLAAETVGDTIAAIVTFGVAAAALPLIVEAAELAVETMVENIIGQIIGEVIGAVCRPAVDHIGLLLSKLDWSQSGGTAGPPQSMSVEPAGVTSQAAELAPLGKALSSQAGSLAGRMLELFP